MKGKQFKALVDTGASTSFLLDEECVSLGLKAEGGRNVQCMHGDWKQVPLFSGLVEIADKPQSVHIAGLPKGVVFAGNPITAIAGTNALRIFKLELDWPKGSGTVQ